MPLAWNMGCLCRFIDGDGRAVAVAVRISIGGRVVDKRGVTDLIDSKGQAVVLILVNRVTGQAASAVFVGGAAHRDRRVKAPTAGDRSVRHRVLVLVDDGDDNGGLPLVAVDRGTGPGQCSGTTGVGGLSKKLDPVESSSKHELPAVLHSLHGRALQPVTSMN